MAKTGFWLRGAKGKLAGATIYKSGKDTVMRQIVSPSNPRSNGQMIQRAIMATIMKAYSSGKAIFDHSFQGKKVGAENQREFMALNLAYLRKELPLANSQARVVGPKALSPVANSYIVSRGSYAQTLFGKSLNTIVPLHAHSTINYRVYFPKPEGDESIGSYFNRVGLVNGDIYTLIAFGVATESVEADYGIDDYDAKQYSGMFGYIRMVVNNKLNATELADPAYAAPMNLVFDVTSNMPGLAEAIAEAPFDSFFPNENPEYGFYIQAIVGDGYYQGAMGCIRSRKDRDLRSNTQLSLITPVDYGISYQYILPVWQQAVDSLASSDLILEGGDGTAQSIPSIESQVPEIRTLTYGSTQLPTNGDVVELSRVTAQVLAGSASNIPANADYSLRARYQQNTETTWEELVTNVRNGAFSTEEWSGRSGFAACTIVLYNNSTHRTIQDVATVHWT